MGESLAIELARDLEGSFEPLVRSYQDRLFCLAFRLTGSWPDAEEIAQDTFVRAYRALRRYPAARIRSLALRPWLYRIAMNVYHNRVRRLGLRTVSLDGTACHPEPPDDAGDRPEQAFERTWEQRELGRHVAALPRRYRQAVILRHVEGLAYREAAALLRQPVGTVKANVHRGMVRLRRALQKEPLVKEVHR